MWEQEKLKDNGMTLEGVASNVLDVESMHT